jgi:chloramphenicol 3-O phosphotransferase
VSARARPDPGLVVVLDGPSGVGTSTTLAALQEAWPRVRTEPLLDVGLDRTLTAFGPELDRWWDLLTPVTSPGSARVHWGPLGRELIGAMHRVVATWASAGWDVALDHLLLDQTTVTDLRAALAGLPVLHVGLTCDPDVLIERGLDDEGEPRPGVLWQLTVFERVSDRDLVIDTTELSTAQIVDVILAAVARRLPLERP